jgi:hypothetical protein
MEIEVAPSGCRLSHPDNAPSRRHSSIHMVIWFFNAAAAALSQQSRRVDLSTNAGKCKIITDVFN